MTEDTGTDGAPITTEDYGRILREAARMRGTFTVNSRDAVAAKELADAGMLLAKPGLDSRGFPVAAGIMGITVKGREWLAEQKCRSWLRIGRFVRESMLILLGAVLAALATRFFGRDSAADCRCQLYRVVDQNTERNEREVVEEAVSVHANAPSVKPERGQP